MICNINIGKYNSVVDVSQSSSVNIQYVLYDLSIPTVNIVTIQIPKIDLFFNHIENPIERNSI